jgi:hypothetical protein
MKRFATLLFVALLGATGAAAQMRTLPPETERGIIRHLQESVVAIDGREMRLAPGAVIRDRDNLIIVPSALPQEGAIAEYVFDTDGQIFRVWLLTPDEAARDRQRP